jgi:hypothetical protein
LAYGLNTTNLVNPLLNTLGASSFVAPAVWVQLHTGDPGAAQTANLSANTTRNQVTFAAATGGSIALASTPTPWNITATETLVAISLWSASTSGVPYGTILLTTNGTTPAPQSVVSGDTFTLLTLTLSLGPLSV